MQVRINGKNECVDCNVTLSSLLAARSLVPEHVVIEHNERIVPREELSSITIKENDAVEIISFVGGG